MRIWLIANMRFPNEKAHGLQVSYMARAYALQGADVTLVFPRRATGIREDARSYYRLPENVRITKLPLIDTTGFGRIGFLFEYLQFALVSGLYVLARAHREDLAISREYACCVLPRMRGLTTAWESHRGEWNGVVALIARLGVRFVVLTRALKELYEKKGVDTSLIRVAPDAVDLEAFSNTETRAACRERLGLPQDAKLALYAGHLYEWKGVDVLAEAARKLPDPWQVAFVGGTDEDIAGFSERYKAEPRIHVMGRKPHEDIPYWLCAADVLVLPNIMLSDLSARYTSPLKLFEYMASGTPIVASDIPSLREVLTEESAAFVPAGDPAALAAGIEGAYGDTERATRARAAAGSYTWDRRASGILSWIQAPIAKGVS